MRIKFKKSGCRVMFGGERLQRYRQLLGPELGERAFRENWSAERVGELAWKLYSKRTNAHRAPPAKSTTRSAKPVADRYRATVLNGVGLARPVAV